MTPDTRTHPYTYPGELRHEIEQLVGKYQVDVQNFRSDDRDRILAEIFEMTEQHFAVARHLLETRECDFFMMVEIGVDRIHHAFWRYVDPTHPRYEPDHRYGDVVRSYYQYLDDEIGELLERFDDDTLVMVVSDHGAQAMRGALCINEWLLQEGYLALKDMPTARTPFSPDNVDWPRTRVWGEGGYYSRIFVNVRGREPAGVVAPDEYEALRDELIERLEALPAPDGTELGTRVYRPEELWRERRGFPPDLIAYFGDLTWRSNGSIGGGALYSFDNDTGPDDANHAREGMCIMAGPGILVGRRDDLSLLDVAPTIMHALKLGRVEKMQGRSLITDS